MKNQNDLNASAVNKTIQSKNWLPCSIHVGLVRYNECIVAGQDDTS